MTRIRVLYAATNNLHAGQYKRLSEEFSKFPFVRFIRERDFKSDLLAVMDGKDPVARYNGYGSCPLTVERGRIVLAEFGYDGELLPTFPQWLINSDQPSKLAWLLKEKMLPTVYYQLMLKGREWLAKPEKLDRV